MSRWTQFIAMSAAQLSGRSSFRDIESTLVNQRHLKYHLGSGSIKRTTLGRANQHLSLHQYRGVFGFDEISGACYPFCCTVKSQFCHCILLGFTHRR